MGPELRAGFTADFIGRPDGLPGLARAYGLRFREVRALLPAVKYQALAAGEVDVIDGYSTDGLIARYDLVVLEDDRRFFPPYEAAALVERQLAERRPEAIAALTELSGRLDVADDAEAQPAARGGRRAGRPGRGDALADLGLHRRARRCRAGGRRAARRGEPAPPICWQRRAGLLRHDRAGICCWWRCRSRRRSPSRVPLGLALERRRGGAEPVIRAVGLLQTIPSIALLAFMIPLLGIGVLPALVALFLYSLYPILRNTYTGVRDAAPDAVAAGTALGMTPRQVLRHVRLPLAAPVIMAGIRTAAVINVGTATLAAFIGAGGLGDPIAAGLALSDTRMILSGALPAAAARARRGRRCSGG